MQRAKQNTILDQLLKQKNAYMKQGTIFQRVNDTKKLRIIQLKELLE